MTFVHLSLYHQILYCTWWQKFYKKRKNSSFLPRKYAKPKNCEKGNFLSYFRQNGNETRQMFAKKKEFMHSSFFLLSLSLHSNYGREKKWSLSAHWVLVSRCVAVDCRLTVCVVCDLVKCFPFDGPLKSWYLIFRVYCVSFFILKIEKKKPLRDFNVKSGFQVHVRSIFCSKGKNWWSPERKVTEIDRWITHNWQMDRVWFLLACACKAWPLSFKHLWQRPKRVCQRE